MQNRSGRLILNSIYSVLAWFAPVALGILVTPFILKRLGVEGYGVYLVILGFIGYSFTFNVSHAVTKFVAEFRTSGETQRINSAITVSFLISIVAGLFGSSVIAVSAEWMVTDILRISPSFQRQATAALVIGGFSIPLILIGQVFQNVLQGSHRFGVLSVLTNLNWFLLNGGNVLLVSLGFGIDALLTWTLIVAGAVAVISFYAARRAEPEYKLDLSSAGHMFRPVLSYGASIVLYQAFGSLLMVFERAWITRNFGSETAAYYLVPIALVLYFHGFMTSVVSPAFPVLNELLPDRERSIELYRKTSKLLFSLTVLFVLSVCFGGRAFLSAWIDPGFAERSYRIFIIHAFTWGLIVMMLAVWQVNYAFRAAGVNASLVGVWALIAIGLMLFAGGQWNAEGIAASRLIGVAVTLPAIFYVEKRFLGAVQWTFWRSAVLQIGAAALVLSVIEYFAFTMIDDGWLGLAFGWVLGTMGYFGVLLLTGFVTKDEKAALLRVSGLKGPAIQ